MGKLDDLNYELAKLLAGEDALSAETIELVDRVAADHSLIASLPLEAKAALTRTVCNAAALLSHKPFSMTTNVVLNLLVRCFFATIRSRHNFLCPDLLPDPACGAVDEAASILSTYETVFGETSTILYYKGACEYWRGNTERAYALFDRLRLSFSQAYGPRVDQQGSFSIRTIGEITRLARRDVEAPRPATFVECKASEYIVVVGVDEVYLDRYGPRLVESLAEYENVAVHFHVATDDPSRFARKFPRCRNFSFEPEPTFADRIPYYASMRYFRMQEFIHAYKKPIIFVDGDSYFSKSPQSIFELNTHTHVGLNHTRRAYVPWRKFRGGGVFVDSGPNSLVFARYLKNLFWNIFDASALTNYWIDQAILAHAFEASRIYGDLINYVDNRVDGWAGVVHQP